MSLQTCTLIAFVLTILSITADAAFDNSRNDNLAVYWGQNSYGATHSDTANWQKTLSFYCNDDSIDVIPVAFLDVYFSTGGLPHINLANICNDSDFPVFPGSQLANCNFLAADIKACQAKGKILTLSLGGAGGGGSFSSDQQAIQFANTVWNLFLGGSSSTRPFGDAVLDGVDLDIEGGQPTGYIAFVNQIRSLASGASKRYYVTAAPQCVYPDGYLGPVLNGASFDAVYVQFYNNPCGLTHYNEPNGWNYGLWDNWARTVSPNKNVKIYIGGPASSTAAGSGYVPLSTLQNIATTIRSRFPSFGGVMLWDASQAYVNSRYDQGVKTFLRNGGGGPFVFPACSAPTWGSGGNYPAGSQVSYNGYIWQAKWFASVAPAFSQSNDWTAISACSGSGGGTLTPTPTSSTTRPPTSSTTQPGTSSTTSRPSSTTSSSTPTPTGGSCAGVPAWSSSIAYTGGQQVTYNGHLWLAKWWNQAEAPGGASGAWEDQGACTSARSFPRRNVPLRF